MIIQADQEGKDVIEKLCDLALKVGGMKNRKQVNLVTDSIMLLTKSEPAEPSQQSQQPEQSESKE